MNRLIVIGGTLAAVVAVAVLLWPGHGGPPVLVGQPALTAGPGGGPVRLTADVRNSGATPLRLVAVEADGLGTAYLRTMDDGHGHAGDTRVPPSAIPGIMAIPPGGALSLSAGGLHLAFPTPDADWPPGETVPVHLAFADGRGLTVEARAVEAAGEDDMAAMDGLKGMEGVIHKMGTLHEVPDGVPAPSLDAALTPPDADGVRHVDLSLGTFRFDREAVDGPHQAGVGHAHLYIDGIKIRRIYETRFRLPALGPGRHLVRVVLNTNDHRAYAVEGAPITADLTVTVPE